MAGPILNAPAVSVIIPCYDLGEFLDEAVDSVFAQSCQDFEILIVDDGSTEPETCSLLAQYHRPRTRVVHSENRGLPAARNLGLTHTWGKYVCMLDPDDRIAPRMFEKSLEVLEADPSIAFVSHWLRAFGDESWDWTPTHCDLAHLLDTNSVNGAALVRRDALTAVGGFDETMRAGCEDWDLWITLVERGFRGVILPEFLFEYRRRAGSMSRVMMEGDTHPLLYRRLVEKHSRSYGEHLSDLLIRREKDTFRLNREIENLELEQVRWLTPELTRHRDDVAILERKAQRAEEWRALTDARDRLEHSLAETRSALVAMEVSAASAQAEYERSLAETQSALVAKEASAANAEAESKLLNECLSRERQALQIAVRRAYELDASANRAEALVTDLRRSMSWRGTAPIRAVYEAFKRLTGPRS